MRRLTHGTDRRGQRALRATALLTLLTALLIAPATAGAATSGGLKQLAGSAGCLSGAATPPSGCGSVRGLGTDTGETVMTKDGKNVYVASHSKDAIVAFDRNASTGKLTQKSSITGCFTTDASVVTSDGCSLASSNTAALDQVDGLAVSADGTSLYATTLPGDLSTFKRASDGTLTYVNTFSLGGGSGTNSLPAITVSPDDKTVYAAGAGGYGGILWIFFRTTAAGTSHGDLSEYDCIAVSVCSRQVPNMQIPSDLAVTPDNKQLILAGGEQCCTWAVVGFDRVTSGATLGDLDAGTAATADHCITGTTVSNCTTRSGQLYPRGLSIPNNRDIYVAGYYSLTAIQRNASTNVLSPQPASDFCSAYTGSGFTGCVEPRTCDVVCGGRGIAASHDGLNVYTSSESGGSMLSFNRNSSNGAFSQITNPLGCLSAAAVAGCNRLQNGSAIHSVVAEPGNRFVYGAGAGQVFSFAVDHAPVCQNVGTSTTNNASVTVNLSCSDPDGDALTYEKVTDPSHGTLAGISGNQVSYGPQPGTTGTDSFQYRARGAGVASDPATASINVSNPPAPPPPPAPGPGPSGITTLPSTTSINSLAFPKYTKIVNLAVKNLVAGTTVTVTCKTKKKKQQKKGCPYKRKRVTTTGARAKLNLRKPFKNKKLPVGAKITITIAAPGFIGKQIQYTVRKRKIPSTRVLCVPPGGKAARCA
jgi:hypothetical protein